MFGTLTEAPAAGTPARLHHRDRPGQPLPQGGLSGPAQRPLPDPARRPRARPSFPSPARSTISSASRRSAPSRTDNTVRYKRRLLQLPADRHRRHYVKATVRVHEYSRQLVGRLPRPPMLWRDTGPPASPSTPQPGRPRDPLRRDPPRPVGTWTVAPRLTTSPQANRNNRSGQLIWYINRSSQNVLDIRRRIRRTLSRFAG